MVVVGVDGAGGACCVAIVGCVDAVLDWLDKKIMAVDKNDWHGFFCCWCWSFFCRWHRSFE